MDRIVLKMKYTLLILLFLSLNIALSAQVYGFSEGKNLAQLKIAVFNPPVPSTAARFFLEIPVPPQVQNLATYSPLSFLPKWSADNLPFFCKIEHDWGKNSRLPLKFRLGSTDYVNWLEGK